MNSSKFTTMALSYCALPLFITILIARLLNIDVAIWLSYINLFSIVLIWISLWEQIHNSIHLYRKYDVEKIDKCCRFINITTNSMLILFSAIVFAKILFLADRIDYSKTSDVTSVLLVILTMVKILLKEVILNILNRTFNIINYSEFLDEKKSS